MHNHLSWSSALSISVYIYCVLSLLLAMGLWYLRHRVLPEHTDLLFKELPEAAGLIQDARLQLRQVNRQVDRSIDQIESMLNLVQGLFLALVETKVVTWVLKKIGGAPLPVKMVAKKGLGQAFKVVHERVKHKNIEQDEAAS